MQNIRHETIHPNPFTFPANTYRIYSSCANLRIKMLIEKLSGEIAFGSNTGTIIKKYIKEFASIIEPLSHEEKCEHTIKFKEYLEDYLRKSNTFKTSTTDFIYINDDMPFSKIEEYIKNEFLEIWPNIFAKHLEAGRSCIESEVENYFNDFARIFNIDNQSPSDIRIRILIKKFGLEIAFESHIETIINKNIKDFTSIIEPFSQREKYEKIIKFKENIENQIKKLNKSHLLFSEAEEHIRNQFLEIWPNIFATHLEGELSSIENKVKDYFNSFAKIFNSDSQSLITKFRSFEALRKGTIAQLTFSHRDENTIQTIKKCLFLCILSETARTIEPLIKFSSSAFERNNANFKKFCYAFFNEEGDRAKLEKGLGKKYDKIRNEHPKANYLDLTQFTIEEQEELAAANFLVKKHVLDNHNTLLKKHGYANWDDAHKRFLQLQTDFQHYSPLYLQFQHEKNCYRTICKEENTAKLSNSYTATLKAGIRLGILTCIEQSLLNYTILSYCTNEAKFAFGIIKELKTEIKTQDPGHVFIIVESDNVKYAIDIWPKNIHGIEKSIVCEYSEYVKEIKKLKFIEQEDEIYFEYPSDPECMLSQINKDVIIKKIEEKIHQNFLLTPTSDRTALLLKAYNMA